MTIKIAIIGAGPAGLYTANLLHDKNYDITIFEEHGFIGSNHCTGVISESTFRMLNVKREVTLNRVKSIVITDLKNSIEFKLKDNVLVINRPKLEENLLSNIENNVHLRLNRKVLKIDSDGHVVTRDGIEKFDLIINAEGSKGIITKSIIPSWRYDYVYGLQCDCKIVKDHYLIPSSDDEVIVIFNHKLSRYFFSWIVPLGNGWFRVGLADTEYTYPKLIKLLRILKPTEMRRFSGGKIILGPSPKILGRRRVILLGDAAGQVKPFTGGGIAVLTLSSQILCKVLNIVDATDLEKVVNIYSRIYWKLYGNMEYIMNILMKILYRNCNELIYNLLRVMNNSEVIVQDYDNHVEVIVSMLSRFRSLIKILTLIMCRFSDDIFIKHVQNIINELN